MMTRVLLVQLFVQLLLQWLPAAAKRRIGKDWSKMSDDDWGRLDVSALFCGLLKRVARCRPLAALLCGPRPVMRVLTSAALLCRHTLGVCIHTYSARSASAAPPCRHELRLCVAMSCATVSPTVAPPCPQQLRPRASISAQEQWETPEEAEEYAFRPPKVGAGGGIDLASLKGKDPKARLRISP